MRKFSVPFAAMVIISLGLAGCGERDLRDLAPLEEIRTKIALSGSEHTAVAQAVREALRKPTAEIGMPVLPVEGTTQIFLSLFLPGESPAFFRSDPGSATECLSRAVALMRKDESVKRFEDRASEVRIKIDFLTRREKLKIRRNILKMGVEPGLDGLILQKKNELVYQPPWDILTGDWEVPEGDERALRRYDEQFERLSKAAGRGKTRWRTANLYRFRTDSFIQDRTGAPARSLYRGLVQSNDPPTEAQLRRALSEAADWIVRTTSAKGKFTYLYYPVKDEENFALNYGVVRHAAAVWGMFAANKVLSDAAVGRCAEQSLGYMRSITGHPLFAPAGVQSVRQNYISFLGAAALGLLAITEKPREAVTADEKTLARSYADFLILMQRPDGSFYGSYPAKLIGWKSEEPPLYFPGESLLALIRYQQWTGDPGLLDPIRRAAKHQIAYFRKSKTPDAWLAHALSILAAIDADPEWRKGCFEVADYYVAHQYGFGKNPTYPDYLGGFDNSRPPRATPAASRTEALAAAFDLAHRTGDPKAETYGDAVLAACRFIMNNQYREEIDYFVRDPARARGGIRGGLVDNTVRIDYNQHAMIAFMGGLDVLADRAAAK